MTKTFFPEAKPLVEYQARYVDHTKADPSYFTAVRLLSMLDNDHLTAVILGADLWPLVCANERLIFRLKNEEARAHVLQGQVGWLANKAHLFKQVLTDTYLRPEDRFVAPMSVLAVYEDPDTGIWRYVEFPMIKLENLRELREKVLVKEVTRGPLFPLTIEGFHALSKAGVSTVVSNSRLGLRLLLNKSLISCMSPTKDVHEFQETGLCGHLLGVKIYLDDGSDERYHSEDIKCVDQDADVIYTIDRQGHVEYRELDL